jgi:hypothetical protein
MMVQKLFEMLVTGFWGADGGKGTDYSVSAEFGCGVTFAEHSATHRQKKNNNNNVKCQLDATR